jgi:hypothetical protein
VPVTAARQAEVGAADAQPAVGGGVGQHRGDELTVGLLDGVALRQRPLRLGDAGGEGIAELLELAEVEDPRRARGTDPMRHVHAPESLRDQPGQLALEPSDLPPELGTG